MRHISQIDPKAARTAANSRTHQDPPGPTPIRSYRRLEEMRLDHLAGEQRNRLQAAINGAIRWINGRQAGISYVITGPYGTGKTTILRNLEESTTRWVHPMVPGRDHHRPGSWEGMIPDPTMDPVQVRAGRFATATEIMAIVDPARRLSSLEGWGEIGRNNLETILRGVEVVAIDDLGTEEIPYTRAGEVDVVRQNRYREILDYCLAPRGTRSPISVLVSSSVPLIADGKANPAFIDLLGGAAWSRLYEASRGFMFDLSGLPDYRITQGRQTAV